MSRRAVTFEGRVYKARPTRGPQNKDFTLEDLKQLSTELIGTKVRYNHKDDKVVKDKRIGHIERAWIDDEEHLVVQGKIRGPNEIGEKLFEKIREDLVSKRIPMLSMHWTGQAANPGAPEDEKVAIPDTRWMREISLVEQGFYPEANIISVAAAGDRTAWEVYASLLTTEPERTSPVSTKAMESAQPPAPAAVHAHAALLKVIAESKIPAEEKKKYETDPLVRDQAYAKVFGDTLALYETTAAKLSKYEESDKRKREAWAEKANKQNEELGEQMKTLYDKDEERAKHFALLKDAASNYEKKDAHALLFKTYADLASTKSQMMELKKMLPTPESIVKDEKTASEIVSVAASLQRNNEPKRQATGALAPIAGVNPSYVHGLLASLGNKI